MRFAILPFFLASFFAVNSFGQTVKDQLGYTQLAAELGASVPDGNGLNVAIVEAPRSNGGYLPDENSAQFTGKTIIDGSGISGTPSSHASNVGFRFFGNSVSMSGGIDDIVGFEANDFLIRVLGAGTGTDPLPDSFDVTNHSYIASGLSAADKFVILSRFDFLVNRDNTVAVVGANNGATSATPDLLAPSYNAITVGRTSGGHSQTLTSDYGAQRTKPDIVNPENSTSNATPFVASAAALLLDAAQGSNGAENEAIKAMLFAGATKEEFPDWDRTSTRPIDETFGFGELNIYNSYKIFEGGEFDGQTSDPATNVGLFGYDFQTFDGSNDLFYDFEITDRSVISAVLTWNAVITDTDPTNVFSPTLSVSNLDLRLYDSSGGFLEMLVDDSVSTDYNHEHVYMDLEPGQYTLRVSGDSAADFGLAWRVVQIPQVASVEMNAGEVQRSAIETLSITFDGEVSIEEGAFAVIQRSTAIEETFEDVTINVSEQVVGNQTEVTIVFDSHVRNSNGALEDGNYQLTVDASLVTNSGIPMSENLVFGAVEADSFFAFYGDSDGNRTINIFDLLAFRQTYLASSGDASYLFFMDFDANDIVNIFDLLQVRTRYLSTIPFEFGSSLSRGGSFTKSKNSDSAIASPRTATVKSEAVLRPIRSANLRVGKSIQPTQGPVIPIPELDLSDILP